MMDRSAWKYGTLEHDTEKVGKGFKNMLEMRKTESLQNWRNDGLVTHTSIYVVPSIRLLRFSAENKNRPETPTYQVKSWRFVEGPN